MGLIREETYEMYELGSGGSERGYWLEFARIECDFCSAKTGWMEPGEIGAPEDAGGFGRSWTRWIGDLWVCPDCRCRMMKVGGW